MMLFYFVYYINWEDKDVGGRTILKMDLREIGWDGMAQFRKEWRALVNTVMNVRVP
jgi:hypothetical protein